MTDQPFDTPAATLRQAQCGAQDKPFTAVLVDYAEDLFTPPDWVGDELARYGITWTVGQHRTPEAVLEAARSGAPISSPYTAR